MANGKTYLCRHQLLVLVLQFDALSEELEAALIRGDKAGAQLILTGLRMTMAQISNGVDEDLFPGVERSLKNIERRYGLDAVTDSKIARA